MATVFLPSELAAIAGGPDSFHIDAARVDDLIRQLTQRYPAMASVIARMAVAVDGEIHNDPDYLPLAPDTEVHFVPRIAGG